MSYQVSPVLLDLAHRAESLNALPPPIQTKFHDLLTSLQSQQTSAAPSSRYTVKKGDTLSGICEDYLKKSGKPSTQTDIYTAVRGVAQFNKLCSPDRIGVDQVLDLSVVTGRKSARAPLAQTSVAKIVPLGGRPTLMIKSKLATLKDPLPIPAKSLSAQQLADLKQVAKPVLAVAPTITSEFGSRNNPFTGKPEFHGGIDLAVPQGTRVYPPIAGTVSFSGWQPGYGNVVVVKHENGIETLYAHNSVLAVRAGQKVNTNTVLSRVGSTGDSTGPHLHFELHQDGQTINPELLVSRPSLQIAKAL